MDAATLQNRIYKGYAKAASRIGYTTDVYRPVSAANPLAYGNKIASIPVSFNAEDMTYSRPNKYAKPTWYALLDGTLVKVGDYLQNNNDGTFFIAAMQQALPVLVVSTNRTINVLRAMQQTATGAVGYNGDTVATETALMTAWPASVLIGTKGEKNAAGLPGDSRQPWWAILLPAVASVVIRPYDIITDELSRRYIVSSAELTGLGWRLTAEQVLP